MPRFDVVICYGGPISYVFDRRVQALAELHRVMRPHGVLLLSVMSLWGTIHEKLPGVLTTGPARNKHLLATGDLQLGDADGTRHDCHVFRSGELRALLEATGFQIIEMAASNVLSTVWGDRLADFRTNEDLWNELLEMEVAASSEPGCLDLGTHLIAVLRHAPGATDAS